MVDIMSEMTGWLPPHIKPVRKGIYQIKYTSLSTNPNLGLYATWNGFRWSSGSFNKRDSYHQQFYGAIQEKYWRGFTEEQK